MRRLTLALALALTINGVAEARCNDLKANKTYKGVGYGDISGLPNAQIPCKMVFKKITNDYAIIHGRKSFCEGYLHFGPFPVQGAASKKYDKVKFGGRIALKGCKIVKRSNAMVTGTFLSRTKGKVRGKSVEMTLVDVGFWMEVRR